MKETETNLSSLELENEFLKFVYLNIKKKENEEHKNHFLLLYSKFYDQEKLIFDKKKANEENNKKEENIISILKQEISVLQVFIQNVQIKILNTNSYNYLIEVM